MSAFHDCNSGKAASITDSELSVIYQTSLKKAKKVKKNIAVFHYCLLTLLTCMSLHYVQMLH